jgi:HEPN superfamily RiboL-PSP-like protein
MASKARHAFDESCHDVDRLLEIHSQLGGSGQGRRYQLEVLNKSAIVLITAIWEAYCEDIVAEGIQHLVTHSTNASALSKGIKKNIAKELKADLNELSVWQLADSGWKAVLQSRLAQMNQTRARNLNTPKSENLKVLFSEALGIDDISKTWYWEGMSFLQAAKKLDDFVTLRGEIAHRGAGQQSVTRFQVDAFLNHVKRLVGKTGKQVNKYVKDATGQAMW